MRIVQQKVILLTIPDEFLKTAEELHLQILSKPT